MLLAFSLLTLLTYDLLLTTYNECTVLSALLLWPCSELLPVYMDVPRPASALSFKYAYS